MTKGAIHQDQRGARADLVDRYCRAVFRQYGSHEFIPPDKELPISARNSVKRSSCWFQPICAPRVASDSKEYICRTVTVVLFCCSLKVTSVLTRCSGEPWMKPSNTR